VAAPELEPPPAVGELPDDPEVTFRTTAWVPATAPAAGCAAGTAAATGAVVDEAIERAVEAAVVAEVGTADAPGTAALTMPATSALAAWAIPGMASIRSVSVTVDAGTPQGPHRFGVLRQAINLLPDLVYRQDPARPFPPNVTFVLLSLLASAVILVHMRMWL
jgi:hypothetical protein